MKLWIWGWNPAWNSPRAIHATQKEMANYADEYPDTILFYAELTTGTAS